MNTWRIFRILLLLLLMFGYPSPLLYAQTTPEESELNDWESLRRILTASEVRRATIQQEIVALGQKHPWAGVYYLGDGTGTNITLYLAPHAGFDYRWEGCVGLFDFDYGRVESNEQTLLLHPNRQHHGIYRWVMADPYIPLQWGDRQYLISENQWTQFCNAINAKEEPRDQRYGDFFLREGDADGPVEGLPDLPEPYHHYILSSPLTATIVDIVREDMIDDLPATIVTINAGSFEGVYQGMRLHVVNQNSVQWLDIFDVDQHAATGSILHLDGSYPLPKKGWEFSSLPEWNRE